MRYASLLGPLVVLPLGTSLSGLPLAFLLVFVPVFSNYDLGLFGWGSNIRYAHLKELIFSFPMVFILSQSDICVEKVIGYKVKNVSLMA